MRAGRTSLAFTLLLAPVLALGGCDVPTRPPVVEQRWMISVGETRLEVEELLPSGVSTTAGAFRVELDPIGTGASLRELCPDCAPLDGETAVVPPFAGSFTADRRLPDEVEAATVTGGSIDLAIENGLSFDPIAGGGTMTLSVAAGEGGEELGTVTLDGAQETLAPGTTTERTLPLGEAVVEGPLHIRAHVEAAGGQVAEIDLDDRLDLSLQSGTLLVSSATIDVTNKSVSLETTELDVQDVDAAVTERITGGALLLEVTNPFSIGVRGTIDIAPTSRDFSIPSDEKSTVALRYSGDELRSFLGHEDVVLSGSGNLSDGTITVRPDQEIFVDGTLDVTLEIG